MQVPIRDCVRVLVGGSCDPRFGVIDEVKEISDKARARCCRSDVDRSGAGWTSGKERLPRCRATQEPWYGGRGTGTLFKARVLGVRQGRGGQYWPYWPSSEAASGECRIRPFGVGEQRRNLEK